MIIFLILKRASVKLRETAWTVRERPLSTVNDHYRPWTTWAQNPSFFEKLHKYIQDHFMHRTMHCTFRRHFGLTSGSCSENGFSSRLPVEKSCRKVCQASWTWSCTFNCGKGLGLWACWGWVWLVVSSAPCLTRFTWQVLTMTDLVNFTYIHRLNLLSRVFNNSHKIMVL